MLSHSTEPPVEMLAEIRQRLGRVCRNYSDEEFSELVRQIAVVRAKYDTLRAESFFNSATLLAAERLSAHSLQPSQPNGSQS